MKKDSKESIQKQVNYYTAKHQEADEQLIAEERKRVPNATRIRQLKKLKLMRKDKLTELNQRLASLKKPPKPSAEVISLPLSQPVSTVMSPRRAASG